MDNAWQTTIGVRTLRQGDEAGGVFGFRETGVGVQWVETSWANPTFFVSFQKELSLPRRGRG